MIRPTLVLLPAALAVGCASDGIVEPAFDAKGDGFSSNVRNLGALDFGGEAEHSFDADFQFFAFTFDARKAADIAVEVTQRGSSRGLDTTLFLYRMAIGAEPQRIAFDDDAGFGALSKIDDFRLFSDDRYAIVIGTKNANGRGNFRVTLSCLAGECAPPQDACPQAMQDSFFECVEVETVEFSFEATLHEVASEVCGTIDELTDIQKELCSNMSASFCESDDAVFACERFALATYPDIGSLANKLETQDNSAMTTLVSDVNSTGKCGDLGPDAGCRLDGVVLSLSGQSVAVEQLLAHSRTLTGFGPGVFPKQKTGPGAGVEFDSFLSFFGLTSDYAAVVESLDLDPADAVFGTASGDEFQFEFGDCTGSIALAYFPDDAIVIDFNEVFCAG